MSTSSILTTSPAAGAASSSSSTASATASDSPMTARALAMIHEVGEMRLKDLPPSSTTPIRRHTITGAGPAATAATKTSAVMEDRLPTHTDRVQGPSFTSPVLFASRRLSFSSNTAPTQSTKNNSAARAPAATIQKTST